MKMYLSVIPGPLCNMGYPSETNRDLKSHEISLVYNISFSWPFVSKVSNIAFSNCSWTLSTALIARFMGPRWGPPGVDRTQVGPMLAPWILLYGCPITGVNWPGILSCYCYVALHNCCRRHTDCSGTFCTLQRRHNGGDGVSNHQTHDCLLNRLFKCRSKKHQSSASLAFAWRIHRWSVNSPHKWPVTRKMFPFDDVFVDCYGAICNCYGRVTIIAAG